jgi:hypothetical protein
MLRRHSSGTSVVVVLLVAIVLAAGGARYLAERDDEYEAEASAAVVPVERLDDAEMLEAYGAMDAGGMAETLALVAQRQVAADLEEGALSLDAVDGSSMILATGTASSAAEAEGIADDGISALSETDVLRGPFEVEEVTAADGAAVEVDPPWITWAILVGVAIVGLVLIGQLVRRGLARRHRRLDVDGPARESTVAASRPAPAVPVANGVTTNGNGAGRPLEELAPITWSAPPPG